MTHVVTTQKFASHQRRTRRVAAVTAPPTARTRLALPVLPETAAERAQALQTLASAVVATYGPVAAKALASWIDETADDAVRG